MERNQQNKLFCQLALVPIIMAAMLFVFAGTLNYWEGWLFLVIYSVATTLMTLNLMHNDPALLERRMRSGPTAEKRGAQKIIMSCVTVLFIAMFIVSPLDHRLGWSHLPIAVVLIGQCMVALGFIACHVVIRENSFASATIEIANGQKVISTGPYQWVRHPMYFGGLVMLLGIPIALGSLWAVLLFMPMLPVLIWRIIDEEKLLNQELDGYTEYCAKVKYRLVPWVY